MDSSSYNVKLRNNIVWVQAGYDVYVADNSRTGLNSDYNDLYIGSGAQRQRRFLEQRRQQRRAEPIEQLAVGHGPGRATR